MENNDKKSGAILIGGLTLYFGMIFLMRYYDHKTKKEEFYECLKNSRMVEYRLINAYEICDSLMEEMKKDKILSQYAKFKDICISDLESINTKQGKKYIRSKQELENCLKEKYEIKKPK